MEETRKSTITLLHNLMEAYEDACRPVCKQTGLTQTALSILLFLANNPAYDTARDISKYMGIKPSLVSFHVERLVQAGHLQRQPIPGNRRSVKLICTAQAQPAIEAGRGAIKRFCAMLTQGMGQEDRCRFQGYLECIENNITQLREGRNGNV